MKKSFFPILGLIALICIILVVFINLRIQKVECDKQEAISRSITVTIQYDRLALESDFQKYTNAYSDSDIAVPEKYGTLVKLNAHINNSSEHNLTFFDLQRYIDENVYFIPGAADLEPTLPIMSNDEQDFDLYVYVNSDLSNDKEIQAAFSKAVFSFACITEDGKSQTTRGVYQKSNDAKQ